MSFFLTILCMIAICHSFLHAEESSFSKISSGPPQFCSSENASDCIVDSYIGNDIILEDTTTRIWNFTLPAGEMTSMHRHDCGYHFVALSSTMLEVWGENGKLVTTFDVTAGSAYGFLLEGDMLVQTVPNNPVRVPRTHAAKNMGTNTYHEILFESSVNCPSRPKEEL
jgi:hypothetical protein